MHFSSLPSYSVEQVSFCRILLSVSWFRKWRNTRYVKHCQCLKTSFENHFPALTIATIYHCTQLQYLPYYLLKWYYSVEAYLQVTAVILTPLHLKLMADSADLQQGDLHSLKVIGSSGTLTLQITECFKRKVKSQGFNLHNQRCFN